MTQMLSSIFDSKDDLDLLAQRFIKKLNGPIAKNFKKIRVSSSKKSIQDMLYEKMRNLKDKVDESSKNEMEKVLEEIAKGAEERYDKIRKDLSQMKAEGGKINSQKFWKMKKTMFNKNTDAPAAFHDAHGNLLTSDKAIQERVLEVVTERLNGNPMEKHLEDHEKEVNRLCETRLKLTKLKSTDPWTMDDLNLAIKDLDNDKARDALGHANELFKVKVAGTDLKLATLKLMNHMKKEHRLPKALQACNITLLYKNKGSRKDLMQYRGVFRVTVLRSILDRLMYNDLYETIDHSLTDGNVGARKERNIRDNLFVLGAVINSVVNDKQEPIQVQVMDIDKCFDKLWLESTTNALFDAGVQNELLNLLYMENDSAKIAIKINGQLTKSVYVRNVEMQGNVWGSLKCTT